MELNLIKKFYKIRFREWIWRGKMEEEIIRLS